MAFIKKRDLDSISKSSIWGEDKYLVFNFPSREAMTLSEVEIMTAARQIYPYVPRVIKHDLEKEELHVELVKGRTLDVYLRETKNLDLVKSKFQSAIDAFRSKPITLEHQGKERYSNGYITYHDYHPLNFIMDSNDEMWFIDWDVSGLYPKERFPDDDAEISAFLKFLDTLV